MLKYFLPRQENFFQLFQQAVDKLVQVNIEFSNLLLHLENQHHYVEVIATHEDEADRIAHANFEMLHKTFITPFDRHDIHHLTSALDDIIDLINRIAQRFSFYQLKTIPTEMVELSQLSIEASQELKQAVYCLPSLKNANTIFMHCDRMDQIESQAHQVVLAGEEKLFRTENDFKQFFKLKEIYHYTKLGINRCQDVGNLLKGIVLEYS